MRTVLTLVALVLCACSADKPEGPPEGEIRIGQLMMETGRRMELSGRAATTGRWDFSEYEVHEIEELFEEDLPRALLPPESNDEIADQMLTNLERQKLPALRGAAHRHDRAAFDRAFADAATTCNGCHRACEVSFVEVPTVPGNSVPNIDPVNPN